MEIQFADGATAPSAMSQPPLVRVGETSAKERIKSQFQEQFGEETDMVAAGAYVEVKPHTVFVTIEDDNDPTRTWPNPEELSRIQDSNWEIGKIETDRIWVDRGSEPMVRRWCSGSNA